MGLERYIASILAGMIIGYASLSHATVPEVRRFESVIDSSKNGKTPYGTIIREEEVRIPPKNEVGFLKIMYDRDSDGKVDFEVYLRVCNNEIVSKSPYFVYYVQGDVYFVYSNLNRDEIVILKREEADIDKIYASAPSCQ